MSNMQNTSFQRWLEPRLLKAYGAKTDKDSPLDLPRALVTKTFIAALIAAAVLTNVVMHGLWSAARWQLGNISFVLESQEDLQRIEDEVFTTRARKLLPPELHNKLRFDSNNKPEAHVQDLLKDNRITFEEAEAFLGVAHFNTDKVPGLGNAIIGRLDYGYILLAPLYDANPPSEVLGYEEFDRPNFRSISTLTGSELDYALGVGLITKFREEITSDYFQPRRLMQALGGFIQFTTFVIALWGLFMIFIRWYWTRVQRRVLQHGRLLADVGRSDGVWDVLKTRASETPLFSAYIDRTGDSLVTVRLIREMIAGGALEPNTDAKALVEDRIDLMEARVQKSEYLVLDYINYAVPNLGFIGTILGIILSMASVVGILKSSGVLDMVEAFDKVGGALGLAFDTTFVSLVWVLVLSLLIARLQKREAELFDELREKGVLFASGVANAA